MSEEVVHNKRPDLWKEQIWVLKHDNASSCVTPMAKNNTTVLPHPPYSPNSAPVDFFLFLNLKLTLKGHSFETVEKIQKNIETLEEVHHQQGVGNTFEGDQQA